MFREMRRDVKRKTRTMNLNPGGQRNKLFIKPLVLVVSDL